ncbi:SAM-dependent methyltransferase [Candidatus Bathyarchaeota archaeon]|nr:SAM-dependent methyltransferase [Candidatus Bathyarchaeota archaeon]
MSYEDNFANYLKSAEAANTHTGKLIAFSELMKSIFGVQSYEIVPNVEQYIKTGGLIALKGRMDLHLGQTIIEFKIDLAKELDTGLEEIKRYVEILRKKGQKVAECIITDGTKFRVFTIQEKPKEVRIINFAEVTPEQAIMFLDTFLFSGRQVPTAYDLNLRFGPGSLIYEEIIPELSRLFKTLKDPVKFELWSKNMQLVYGAMPTEEAFVAQTYLMMLVRLLLARQIIKEKPPILESLNGSFFDSKGIKIIEEDFFSWILTPLFWTQFKPLVDTITDALDTYDIESVDEDIFKEIYQEIVKRGERHRIGEYYTPEWLAELTLNEAISVLDPQGKRDIFSILDPACGSGTFLTNAISLFKKKKCSLKEIVENIYGMDLNPLAVAISRANYLLALGGLISQRKGTLFIPVYMADSIKLPKVRKELVYGISILAIDVNQKSHINLPLEIGLNEKRLKGILELFTKILWEYKRKRITRNQVQSIFEKSRLCEKRNLPVVKNTLETLMDLIDADKDSIWIFMLRNIYAPLRMREKKFDIVVGNPPWVSLRYIENSEYQNFLKEIVFNYELLGKNETALFTQMDTSTVFYAKVADTYLSPTGVLAFVMPRSVLTGAKQHTKFRRQRKPLMKLVKILDTEKVNPLFKVDSCSLVAKKGHETVYPISSVLISGVLPEKNIRLKKATKFLTFIDSHYSPPAILENKSQYHDKLMNGAGIYPRTLWVVKFVPGKFGINPEEPSVESLLLPEAKEPWGTVKIEGEIEKDFVFATLISKYLLPFKAEYLPIVLPLKKGERSWTRVTPKNLRSAGKFKMAEWVDKAQNAWETNATEKNLRSYPNAMDYVNYNNKLIDQRLDHRYYVVYTASGTHIASAMVDTNHLPDFYVEKTRVSPKGFVPDVTTFYFSTNNKKEAQFLMAILNSTVLYEKIKPQQTRGKFGPRHIHRRPFEFPIPKYDASNELHEKIALAGEKASEEAADLEKTSRLKIKNGVSSMKDIDKLVHTLLKGV